MGAAVHRWRRWRRWTLAAASGVAAATCLGIGPVPGSPVAADDGEHDGGHGEQAPVVIAPPAAPSVGFDCDAGLIIVGADDSATLDFEVVRTVPPPGDVTYHVVISVSPTPGHVFDSEPATRSWTFADAVWCEGDVEEPTPDAGGNTSAPSPPQQFPSGTLVPRGPVVATPPPVTTVPGAGAPSSFLVSSAPPTPATGSIGSPSPSIVPSTDTAGAVTSGAVTSVEPPDTTTVAAPGPGATASSPQVASSGVGAVLPATGREGIGGLVVGAAVVVVAGLCFRWVSRAGAAR